MTNDQWAKLLTIIRKLDPDADICGSVSLTVGPGQTAEKVFEQMKAVFDPSDREQFESKKTGAMQELKGDELEVVVFQDDTINPKRRGRKSSAPEPEPVIVVRTQEPDPEPKRRPEARPEIRIAEKTFSLPKDILKKQPEGQLSLLVEIT